MLISSDKFRFVHGCDGQLLFCAADTPMLGTYQRLYLKAYFGNSFFGLRERGRNRTSVDIIVLTRKT